MVKFNQLEKDLSQIEGDLVRLHETDLEQDRNITELKTKIASANNDMKLISHKEFGVFDCAQVNITQQFKHPYNNAPHVYLSMSELEGLTHKNDTWYDVEVNDVQTTNFSVNCMGLGGSQFESLKFSWLSLPRFE